MLEDIAPEKLELLAEYRSKWQQKAFSVEPLDKILVRETVNRAYTLGGYREPSLFFFNSPQQAISHLGLPTKRSPLLLFGAVSSVVREVRAQFHPLLWTRLWRRWGQVYVSDLAFSVLAPFRKELDMLPESISQTVETQVGAISDGAMLDFFITALSCHVASLEHWEVFVLLVEECFWHLAFEDICIVFERPIHT